MNFDFALVLVIATAVTGLGYLVDHLFFATARKESVAQALASAEGDLPEEAVEELAKPAGWAELSRSMFPVLLVVLLLRSFLVEPFKIPSGSMLPTLKVGDFILVNKYHYGLRLPVLGTKILPINDPQRGDVAVFKYPEQPTVNFIKRVVGLPGDVIRYHNKTLYVNGKVQQATFLQQYPMPLADQPYATLWEEQLGDVPHQIHKDTNRPSISGEWVVPQGQYFVMGDNRDNSNDSRGWGFVKDELLVGKAFAVWMYWPDWFTISFSDVRTIQ
jgi:signal peptidase I